MATNTLAWKHWVRIISRWPIDRLRPENVSFQTLMKKRLAKYENPAKAPENAKIKGNAADVQPVDLTWNEAKEMRQINALYALLESRFQDQSPLPDRLRFPASGPTHYDMIIQESERAPARGFLNRMSDKLKGMIRLR